MVSKQTLGISLFLTLLLAILLIPETQGKKGGARSYEGGGAEFHLTCTVLVNGSPGSGGDEDGAEEGGEDGGDDEEEAEEEVEARKKKNKKGKGGKSKKNSSKRRRRSLRVKRAGPPPVPGVNKVQLLCDIDNPKGKEIAMRSVGKKKGGKQG